MNIQQKAQAILEDDSYEFWKPDAAQILIEMRDLLVEQGVERTIAERAIRETWYAASAEYGH